MASYKEINAQLEKLHAQAEVARQKEAATVIEQIHELVAQYRLTPADLGLGKSRRGAVKSKLPPKYRDPASGATWSGRGRPPGWLAGKDLAKFAV